MDTTVSALNAELKERGTPRPDLLFLMATGTQHLLDHLGSIRETSLAGAADVPAPWAASTLHSGSLGSLNVWALDDAGAESAGMDRTAPAWGAALPVWLAAAAGAALCVHTSAGSFLGERCGPGFAVLSDHINLSGRNPLTGLGESELGPLFPDQSTLHHQGLRHAALLEAEALGLDAQEAVAACTAGPALETAAERRMLASLGADVSVQGLAAPLIACAHAGLASLALVAASPPQPGATDLEWLVRQAAYAGPRLNQWILSLVPSFENAMGVLRAELSP